MRRRLRVVDDDDDDDDFFDLVAAFVVPSPPLPLLDGVSLEAAAPALPRLRTPPAMVVLWL